jgi:hypothetical protein
VETGLALFFVGKQFVCLPESTFRTRTEKHDRDPDAHFFFSGLPFIVFVSRTNSFATDCGTPSFLASLGLEAAACISLFWALLTLGIAIPSEVFSDL